MGAAGGGVGKSFAIGRRLWSRCRARMRDRARDGSVHHLGRETVRRGACADQRSHRGDCGAIVLVDQAGDAVERRRHLLVVDDGARIAAAVLLRHDHQRRRLGLDRAWSAGLELQRARSGFTNTLRNTPTGTGAFAPAALNDTTIDGLMDNGNVKDLQDGVLLRRAHDVAGSTYRRSSGTSSTSVTGRGRCRAGTVSRQRRSPARRSQAATPPTR